MPRAFEVDGDAGTAKTIGRRRPVRDVVEMRELSGDWGLQSSRCPDLEVLRMGRADLHKVQPGISLGHVYDPEGLDDW